MRKADFDTAWNNNRAADLAQIAIVKISLRSGEFLFPVNLSSRITAFVGKNGAGKTGLLLNLEANLNGSPPINSRSLIDEIQGMFRGKDFILKSGKKSPDNMRAEFIDASSEIYKIKSYLKSQANIDEFTAQYELNQPNVATLSLYRYVTGIPYIYFGVKELESPVAAILQSSVQEDQVFPFFEIKTDNISYNSMSMGFGELCACFLIWKLMRSPQGSLILLDEPDAHLSPASRLAFVNALAFIAHERKLWIGFSTHSLELLSPLKDSEVFIISAKKIGGNSQIDPISHKRQAVRELGLSQIRTLLIAVEDVDAQAAVWSLIHKWIPTAAANVDVVIVEGGATKVEDFINLFPQKTRICKAIAILDGDKRSFKKIKPVIEKEVIHHKDKVNRILFLPSNCDPIAGSVETITTDSANFSRQLGISDEFMRAALDSGKHIDHHDFLSYIIDTLSLEGRTVHDVRYALLNCWLDEPAIASQAEEISKNILFFLD